MNPTAVTMSAISVFVFAANYKWLDTDPTFLLSMYKEVSRYSA